MEQSESRYQEQLEITRAVVHRNELAFLESSRSIADLAASVREMRGELGELRKDLRANSQAILKVLDRLDGGPEPAAS